MITRRSSAALLALSALLPVSAVGQPNPPPGVPFAAGFRAGGEQLFALDLGGTPVGEVPGTINVRRGNVEVVFKDGVRMLKASTASEFLITLPQVLPADFTLEFDLVPKAGGPPPDLSIEGTPTINQGSGSAHLLWQADGYLAVIGGAEDNYETPMPEDFRAALPGVLTQVAVSVEGTTVKLYTNGRRLYTLERQFARGRVLRVSLGGVSDANAVYLAGLRIATGAPQNRIANQTSALTGSDLAGQISGASTVQTVESNRTPGTVLPGASVTPPASAGALGAGPVLPPGQSTETQRSASTGSLTPTFVAGVTVTPNTAGPVVTWLPSAVAGTYTVLRYKNSDRDCCANLSPPLAGPPWQDANPAQMGTYTYRVTITTDGGNAYGESQFYYVKQPATALAGAAPSSGPRSVSVAPPSGAAPTVSVPSAPGALATDPSLEGITGLTVTLTPTGPLVNWTPLRTRAGYAVQRWKIDDGSCCNNATGRMGVTGPPWQDQPLPVSGTYVYRVIALTDVGVTIQQETQFGFRKPEAGPVALAPPNEPAPITAVLVPATTPAATGMVTPSAPAVPSGGATPGGGTRLTGSRAVPNPPDRNTGAPPVKVWTDGSPVTVEVFWSAPEGYGLLGNVAAGITYRVTRALKGTGGWTSLPVTAGRSAVHDIPPDRTRTYTYAVTAVYPDGSAGATTVDYTPPPPVDPPLFVARVAGSGIVELAWQGVRDAKDYFITGPGTGSGISVVGKPTTGIPGVTEHLWGHQLSNLPGGDLTWTIAASYEPGGILTQRAQWPTATLTTAASGKYEISIESVKVASAAEDDLFDGDGLRNEFYVTAFVRTKNQTGNILRETSHRSATHGDITNWPPPARVRAGSAGSNGGVWSGDLISPIWDRPSAGATGWTRLVLWSGTLTAGLETVEVAPAVWEADDAGFRPGQFTPTGGRFTYDDLLRQVGYSILDLNSRTAYGDISNVLLAAEHNSTGVGVARGLGFHINTAEDRPIGIAKKQDAFNDAAMWFPFAIILNHTVAEAALSGAYGPPGLIPIQFVDHAVLSRVPITHPDLGMGNYTLNIRVSRVP